MPQAVTIRSLPRAFELVKAMQMQGLEWGEGYRRLGRDAIAGILQDQMGRAIDEHLDRMAVLDRADRRNGSYRRQLLTELGDIELAVPRTRRFAPIAVVRAYARRPEQIDRMILSCFVLGLIAVSASLGPFLGGRIPPLNTFAANAVRLQLHVFAYNLGNFMHTLAMAKTVEAWSLTKLAREANQIGAKVISHGHYVTSQMAEVAVCRGRCLPTFCR